jgi:hypothetical protein
LESVRRLLGLSLGLGLGLGLDGWCGGEAVRNLRVGGCTEAVGDFLLYSSVRDGRVGAGAASDARGRVSETCGYDCRRSSGQGSDRGRN